MTKDTIQRTNGRKTLVYITSVSRSGSTLLDHLVSNHKDIECVGELRNLNDYINKKGLGHSWGWACTCEKTLDICPFWKKIITICEQKEGMALADVPTRIEESGQSLYLRLLTSLVILFTFPRSLKEYLIHWFYGGKGNTHIGSDYWRILSHISAITQKSIIVDSSKNPAQLYELIKAKQNDWNLKVIHLIRDGRAVSWSHVKRAKRKGKKTSFRGAVIRWLFINIKILNLRSLLSNSDYIMIRYEDLCREPETTISKICQKLSLPFDASMVKLKKGDKHNIGGSPHRFDSGQEIQLDRSWESKVTFAQRLFFNVAVGFLRRKLGY